MTQGHPETDLLHDLLAQEAERADPPEGLRPGFVRRGTRIRVFWALGTVSLVIAAVFSGGTIWTSLTRPNGASQDLATGGGTSSHWVTRPQVLDRLSIQMPRTWSYLTSHQGGASYLQISANHGFNAGDLCAPKTGPLGALLDKEKMFTVIWQSNEPLPSNDPYLQRRDRLRWDPESLDRYEMTSCRRTYRIDMNIRGMGLIIHTAFSPSASQGLRNDTLRSLRSLH